MPGAHRLPFRCLPVLCLLASAGATATATTEAADVASVDFATSLRECAAAEHGTAHPFVRGFTSQHRIEGERDGACRYSQSMPGGMNMECALSPAGREALAKEMDEMADGRMQGSTASAPAWARECEIVTPDGKRMPAFGG